MSITWGGLTKKLIEQAKEREIPFAGAFELTSRCNLKCKMCYICQPANCKEAKSRERTTAEWIRMAEEARDAGALFVTLTGGEVFLREDFKEIYESMTTMGYRITIYTNGTLITPEIAKWLGKIPPSIVAITIYGASEETYDRVCGFPEGFNRVLRGIDLLIAEGVKLELKTTTIRGNSHDFEKLVKLADERGIELGVVDYVAPRREGCYSDPVGERLSAAELATYLKYTKDYKNKNTGKDNIEKNSDTFNVDDKTVKDELWRDSDGAFRCATGKCGFWISWDGRLIPCGLLDEPESYPFETSLSAAWDELKRKCKTVPICTACKECSILEFCRVCPARLKAETGVFDTPAPYICEFTKQTLLIGQNSAV